MWRGACALLLLIFGIVCCEDGKNRQTFVVRYKSGDQTIPVTVVLDHKKQTEYVINMSPRTSAKSVTLYDFKQRTIAYKDLTNRECFLGRLTHETLTEESDALNRVQNPVDHTPKVLSLDPQATSLTPTEIRNMAGQKTAVFCRKMNTWLIMPQHSIQKREVDDEEIDERTFHRHGYHTVRYSHYGRETRRRHRTSNRNATRQLSHRNKDALTIPRLEHSEFEEEDLPTIHSPVSGIDTHRSYPREMDLNRPFTNPHSTGHHLPKEETKPSLLPPIRISSYNEHSPSNADLYNEHQPIGRSPSFVSRDVPHTSEVGLFDANPNVLNSLFENSPNLENSPIDGIEKDLSHGIPTSQNGNIAIPKVFPEPSIYNPIDHGLHLQSGQFDRQPDSSGIRDENSRFQGQIETESSSNELVPHVSPSKDNSQIEDDGLENSELSNNLLQTSKETKRLDNLENKEGLDTIPQANEDLHDVFEGFHNLRETIPPYPTNDHTSLHNSHFIPSEINTVGEHSFPDEPLIQSNPILPRYNFRNINGTSWKKGENIYPQVLHGSSLTTIDYNYNRIYNVYPTDAITTAPDTHGPISGHAFSQHSEEGLTNQRRATAYHENAINWLSTTTFPPLPPYDSSHHRSDIPSESEQDELYESNIPTTIDTTLIDANNEQGPSVVPTSIVKEGISPHQHRFHNILRQYKPDQIVIDIEDIPTQLPPQSNLGFHSRPFATTENPQVFHPTGITSIKKEQTFRESGRSNHSHSAWNPRRYNHFPSGGSSHRRNHVFLQPPNRIKTKLFLRLPQQQVNNIHPLSHNSRHNFPLQFNNRFSHPHPPLDSLPPGVSIHPRHPKAPYADMIHPNVHHPALTQGSHFRTLKPHRQRHHRKKDRFQHRKSCCGGTAKGDCCSAHSGTERSHKSSCCTARNVRNNEIRIHNAHSNGISNALPSRPVDGRFGVQQFQARPNTLPPLQHVRTIEDTRNRCEKQKMCRTLYESTQQVMVCRNAEIEGC